MVFVAMMDVMLVGYFAMVQKPDKARNKADNPFAQNANLYLVAT